MFSKQTSPGGHEETKSPAAPCGARQASASLECVTQTRAGGGEMATLSKSQEARLRRRAVKCVLVRERVVQNLADYFNVLSAGLRPAEEYWFRGHASLTWKLKPSALRYPTEARRNDALALIGEFKRIAEIKLPRVPDPTDDLRWVQVAQHYGLPTRLLDWSENPLVGLYFAAAELPKEDGLVFVVNPVALNRHTNPRLTRVLDGNKDGLVLKPYLTLTGRLTAKGTGPVALDPVWNNDRIMLQQGTFTLHGSSRDGISPSTPSLVGIPVLEEAKPRLVDELQGVGVNEMTIYPELEHASRQLKRRAGLASF